MANNIYGKGDVSKYFDAPTIGKDPSLNTPTDWSKKTQFDPMNQWSYKSALKPTTGEANWKRLADSTIGDGTTGEYDGYSGSGNYKSAEGSGLYQDGMLFEERLANLAPELGTLAETVYQGHKLNEQDRIIQGAKLNSLRAPVTSVAAASDMSPEVLAARQNDIARMRGQYQGADPTMRLISNQMAQQQRDAASNQLNAQRAQFIAQENQRVQQGNARNQAALTDTYNKNQLRSQQLEDNKLAARVAQSERERELYTKGFGAMMGHLENRLDSNLRRTALNRQRDLKADNYNIQTLAQRVQDNEYDYGAKTDLANAQAAFAKKLRAPLPKYRDFRF